MKALKRILAVLPTPMKPTSDQSRGWMSSTLRQIIKSPTIAGLRKYQGKVIGEADWPAIIPIARSATPAAPSASKR